MQFIDECTVTVRAGRGGDGCAAFNRTKNDPRGGPAGGDGGNGGSVIFVADAQLSTLLDLRYQREYKAERGEDGQGRDKYGRGGQDTIVRVPAGTVVFDDESGETLCDLVEAGQRFIAAQGGHGGKGNIHFATATYQAPHRAEAGEPGQARVLRLELRLLADVGLLGYPNVGKSTFVSAVSRARPKIADYPFTTLAPHLGVVGLSGGRSFVVADIPGLIEGAADGHGLGHRFLRHVERARVLLHLLEVPADPEGSDRDPMKDHDVINRELERFDPELARRPQLVALGKMDLPATQAAYPALKAAFAARGIELHAVSAASHEGLAALLEALWKIVRPAP
jgi:GTP-binding protein